MDDSKDARDLVADGLVDIPAAQEFAGGLSRAKVYQLMNSGELQYVKLGKRRFIPRGALIALAARNLRGGE